MELLDLYDEKGNKLNKTVERGKHPYDGYILLSIVFIKNTKGEYLIQKTSKEKDFKYAIDEHLKMCKELNIDPERQCKGSLNVRLGSELHTKAKMKSLEEHISINELIKNAVAAYLKTN